MSTTLFAKSYKIAEVKGQVYVKTADGEFYKVEVGTVIDDEDTLVVEDKSSVSFYTEDGATIKIRTNGNYKVANLVK